MMNACYPIFEVAPKTINQEYVQEYLSRFGERKCEANAIIPIPRVAREYVEGVILSYLGTDATARFEAKQQAARDEIEAFLEESGAGAVIQDTLDQLGL